MPRALHADTKVQRGPAASVAPDELGRFEARDASPRLVLLGLSIAIALLFAGLLFAALLVTRRGGTPSREPRLADMPPPSLLAAPIEAQREDDEKDDRDLEDTRLANAMAAIVAQDRTRSSNSERTAP